MRKIIVINGKGGSGKDELIKHFPEKYLNLSSIDPVKKIARDFGWDGSKDAKGRLFLNQLKTAADSYNNFTNTYLVERICTSIVCDTEDPVETFFVHIREPEKIQFFIKSMKPLLPKLNAAIFTVLVKAPWSLDYYGNAADDGVENYPYDIIFENREGIKKYSDAFYKTIKNYAKSHISND